MQTCLCSKVFANGICSVIAWARAKRSQASCHNAGSRRLVNSFFTGPSGSSFISNDTGTYWVQKGGKNLAKYGYNAEVHTRTPGRPYFLRSQKMYGFFSPVLTRALIFDCSSLNDAVGGHTCAHTCTRSPKNHTRRERPPPESDRTNSTP